MVLGLFALVLGFVGMLPAEAATPPTTVNYQGVLRDQNDKPLSGSYDMLFRFMDADTAGNEVMIEEHAADTGNAVTVSGGLFNVGLGSGSIIDGSGPGIYTSLDAVFRDYTSVWLEVQVGGETLSPRTPIQSAAYALNATDLAGHPDSFFLNASDQVQQKQGQLQVVTYSPSQQTLAVANNAGGTGGTFSGGVAGVLSQCFAAGCRGVGAAANGAGSRAGWFVAGTGATGVFASGDTGVQASGTDTGISATGSSRGAYFTDSGGDSATLASGGSGISASGTNIGSYFSNGSPNFSYTQIPYYDLGIFAYGANYGGQFNAFSTSNFAVLAYSTYKIVGTGTVSFVQNHPTDPSKVIVYVAPEGDEAAVYTRGSGRLVNGEARVRLGETFALVANPDLGLTATATPRDEPIPLAVSEVSPSEVVVRGPAGSSAEFDYMVWGLRIGFEEQSIVQPKQQESKIPSMHMHEQFFNNEPALRKYTALARFEGVEEAVHGKKSVDHSRADRLRDAVGVSLYRDPAGLAREPGQPTGAPPVQLAPAAGGTNGANADGASSPVSSEAPASQARSAKPAGTAVVGNNAIGAGRAVAAALDLFAAEGAIEGGDVVSLTPALPGSVTKSTGPSDSLVIGCAQPGGTDSTAAAPAAGPSPATGQVAVATSHLALCRVDASYGAIAVGDRLSPSPAPGLAMRLDPEVAGATSLGRAIDALPSGVGLIRVLLGGR